MREPYSHEKLYEAPLNFSVGAYRKGYELVTFPAGEPHIKLGAMPNEIPAMVKITAHISTPDEIFELALLKNALDNFCTPQTLFGLFLPYIPFGRQDRVTSLGSAFSLKVFADFLNSMNFFTVDTCDPHSSVSSDLINNLTIQDYSTPLLRYQIAGLRLSNPVIIAPDAGARFRAQTMASELDLENAISARKKRDPATGQITGYEINDVPEDRHLLVVDDICDGGRTFIELAKQLPENRKSLTLFVTHGIFSKGRQVLKDAGYDNVLCAFKFLEEKQNVA